MKYHVQYCDAIVMFLLVRHSDWGEKPYYVAYKYA